VTRIDALLADATARLKSAGIDQPMREARLLLAEASGLAFSTIMAWPEREIGETERFKALLDRRLGFEPLSRILGRREFWSLDFALGPDTLDPRPDSETLVEAVLDAIADRRAPLRLVDFGTGTGCLLLALLSELPNAWGLGLDKSFGAAKVAKANARRLGFADRACFAVGDWDAGLLGRFDIMVSNPPYIPSAEIDGLMPEVRLFDPLAALDGGADGLAPYRILVPAATRLLMPGGLMALECGQGQAVTITSLMARQNVPSVEIKRDLAGIERVIVARTP
jgi:release factor glutamine methyltransferase